MAREGRARTYAVLGKVLLGTGLSVTFLSSLVLGVLVHADLPLARKLVARESSRALTDLLNGTVVVERVSEIGLRRVVIAKATLLDEYGNAVLTLTDIRADTSLKRIAQELVFDPLRPTIVVDHVRVESAEVTLVLDPKTREPTIAHALAAASTATKETPPDTGLRVYLPVIELGRGRVRGKVAEDQPLEADVRRVQGLILGTPKGLAVDVKRFGAVLHGYGTDARGTGTLALRAPGPLRATFEGFVGDVELRATGVVEGKHLSVTADVPRAKPAAVAALLPGWPLRDAVSAHAEGRGDLPHLDVVANVQSGAATIDVTGTVELTNPPSAQLAVKSRHLDARLFLDGAPPTDLTVEGTAAVTVPNGSAVLELAARTEPTFIGGQLVPAASAEATWKDGALAGKGRIDEPGASTTVTFTATKDGVVDFDAATGSVNLAGIPRIEDAALAGSARAKIRGHVEDGAVRASVDADVGNFRAAGVALAKGHVTAQLTGKTNALADLRGTARLTGTGLSVESVTADDVTVEASGSRARMEFDARALRSDGPELRATGTAVAAEKFVVRGTKLYLKRDPVTIEGDVEEFDPSQDRVVVQNVRVTGAGGSLTGAARLGRDLVEVEAEGENVDLDALGRALGLPRGTLGGRMRVSANVVTGHDVTRGRVRLGLGNATLGAVGGLSAQIAADLDDRQITGSASGLVAGIGTFGATWDGELGGPAFEGSSWRDVTGHGEVQVGNVRLPLLATLIPSEVPISGVSGQGFARVLFDRKTSKQAFPSLFATVATRELGFDVRRGEEKTRVAGIDVTATGALDGTTGDATGTTLIVDPRGDLLSATGAVRVDVNRLLADPRTALAQLLDTPLDMVVSLPARDVSALPELVHPSGIDGSVGGNVSVRGSLRKPTLFVTADGTNLALEGAPAAPPVNVHVNGEYEWNSHVVSARATAGLGGRTVATATVQGSVPEAHPESWTYKGDVQLSGIPLGLAIGASKNEVLGTLVGAASITRSPTFSSVSADVKLVDAGVENISITDGRLQISTEGEVIKGSLELSGERGSLEADGTAGIAFTEGYPDLSKTVPVRAHLVSHEMSAAFLSPFVRSIFARLSGRIEADVDVALVPHPAGAETTWTGGVTGTATLTEGSALIDALGLDLRDLRAGVEAHGQGKVTTLSIHDVTGRVRSTKDNVHGSAELTLEGFRLMSGTGQLVTTDLPLLLRGAPQGKVSGNVALGLKREPDRMLVDADIPRLATHLPQSSGRNVVDLTDNPDVAVLQMEKEPDKGTRALPWVIAIRLGNEVRVQRSDVDLGVTGAPVVSLGPPVEVGGSVELKPGGRIPVLGKVFVVDHGRVTFDTGEPGNPRIDVTATWRAPNGTMVSVDVTGTLKEAQVTARSDPPLPKAEVDALILGGSSGADVAMGGIGALGVNDLISDNPVELRVESTSESRPRYTAAVRVRENLWFEASTYQQTDRSGGVGTDRSIYSGTVDYRFSPKWSLRTEAGTAGGAMDLLWQYRY